MFLFKNFNKNLLRLINLGVNNFYNEINNMKMIKKIPYLWYILNKLDREEKKEILYSARFDFFSYNNLKGVFFLIIMSFILGSYTYLLMDNRIVDSYQLYFYLIYFLIAIIISILIWNTYYIKHSIFYISNRLSEQLFLNELKKGIIEKEKKNLLKNIKKKESFNKRRL